LGCKVGKDAREFQPIMHALKRKNNEVHVRSLFLATSCKECTLYDWKNEKKKPLHKQKQKKQEKILKFPH
jgi:hypothetical protein